MLQAYRPDLKYDHDSVSFRIYLATRLCQAVLRHVNLTSSIQSARSPSVQGVCIHNLDSPATLLEQQSAGNRHPAKISRSDIHMVSAGIPIVDFSFGNSQETDTESNEAPQAPKLRLDKAAVHGCAVGSCHDQTFSANHGLAQDLH
jgi:hypothetical protein